MPRVLICSHRVGIARRFSRHLSRGGYQVVGPVSTGQDAVTKAEEYRPDFIVMDIALPGEKDGIAASQIIGQRFGVPIIFTGAHRDENRMMLVSAERPGGYVLVPFTEAEIRAAIDDAVNHRPAGRRPVEPDGVYHMIVENAPESIVVIQDERIVYANSHAVRTSGYMLEVIRSRPFFEFLVPEDRGLAVEEYQRVLSTTAQAPPRLMRVTTGEGRIICVEIRSERVSWDGKPAVFIFAVDVTERRAAEESLLKSERRHRAITEKIRDTVWVLDMDLNTTFVSPSVERVRGYSLEELKSQPLEKQLTGQSLDIAVRNILSAVSGDVKGMAELKLPELLTLEFIRKDGTTYWSEVSISIITDENGQPAEILSVGRDITEWKVAGDLLRTLRKAVESSALGFTISDLSGYVVYTNPAEAKMHGYTVEELIGRPAWSLAPESVRKPMTPQEIGVMRGRTRESINVRKDGTVFPVCRTSDVVRTHAGRALCIVSICEDITRRRQIEAERERLIAELREAIAKVRTLTGLLPICASCKRIRDDKGNWSPIESYLEDRSDAQFSHGICPECAKKLYPRFSK